MPKIKILLFKYWFLITNSLLSDRIVLKLSRIYIIMMQIYLKITDMEFIILLLKYIFLYISINIFIIIISILITHKLIEIIMNY